MKKLIFILLFCLSYGSQDLLISDYDFTNQNFTLSQMYNSITYFRNCMFTSNEIVFMFNECRRTQINYRVLMTKLEQENSLIINSIGSTDWQKRKSRAMAFGLAVKVKDKNGKKYCPYLGFKIQIKKGLDCLRYHFDQYFGGESIIMIQNTGVVYPKNASTYSLYKYCPVYGFYDNCGVMCIGNKKFVTLWNTFKKLKL